MEGTLLVNLMRYSDDKVGDTALNIADFCTDNLSSYSSTFKNLEKLQKQLKTEVIDIFNKKKSSASGSSISHQERNRNRSDGRQSPEGEDTDPLRVRDLRNALRQPPISNPHDPFSIGRGDLDPLAGPMAGGMHMDPMRGGFPDPEYPHGSGGLGMPSRLPRGSVPPGARFDPIGPPDLDGSGSLNPRGGRYRAGPDPDHMRPPGFEDDMFM